MISNVLLSVSNVTVLRVKYRFEFMLFSLFHEQEWFSHSLKMFIAQKRKYVHKTLRGKCQSLKDLEKGLSNKDGLKVKKNSSQR